MRTATRYQLPSAWLQTAAPHSRSQFCAGVRSEDRASLQLKSHASAQGGNAAGLVGAVIGEGKTCQRPMPGIPGGAWSVGPHAIQHFWLPGKGSGSQMTPSQVSCGIPPPDSGAAPALQLHSTAACGATVSIYCSIRPTRCAECAHERSRPTMQSARHNKSLNTLTEERFLELDQINIHS